MGATLCFSPLAIGLFLGRKRTKILGGSHFHFPILSRRVLLQRERGCLTCYLECHPFLDGQIYGFSAYIAEMHGCWDPWDSEVRGCWDQWKMKCMDAEMHRRIRCMGYSDAWKLRCMDAEMHGRMRCTAAGEAISDLWGRSKPFSDPQIEDRFRTT